MCTGPRPWRLSDTAPLMVFKSRFPQAPTLIFNGMIAALTRYRRLAWRKPSITGPKYILRYRQDTARRFGLGAAKLV
jgi:hypothetical protein